MTTPYGNTSTIWKTDYYGGMDKLLSSMHLEAYINLQDNIKVKVNVLLDSGATSDNYLSLKVFEHNIEHMDKLKYNINSYVVLGDGCTKIHIQHAIKLNMDFISPITESNNNHSMIFKIIPTHYDIVIGLPALLSTHHTLFLETTKLETVLDICIDNNIILKFSKSWLGVPSVKFFGYICTNNTWSLDNDRIEAVNSIPFPTSTVSMQRFLGSALFFKPFIPHYSTTAAYLNEMVKKDFNWKDESTWQRDYRKYFNEMKTSLANSCKLHYPDYDLEWVIRCDASELGVGGVLFQIYIDNDTNITSLQPIQFVSKKFSPAATKWSTIEQEGFAIYYTVHTLAYYIRCKSVVIETDHKNLLWIQKSEVPKVIRWHTYLNSFNLLLRHIAGKANIVSDWLSRDSASTYNSLIHLLSSDTTVVSAKEMLISIHNARIGHRGITKTWQLLNSTYPGHNISIAQVKDFIVDCPICQMNSYNRSPSIPPIVKSLPYKHSKHCIGVDTLELIPDKDGYKYLLVVINFFTKHTHLFPVKSKDAITTASCLYRYYSIYGIVDQIRCDPGSDFTSKIFSYLHKWLGVHISLTLVNNPQADGVEPVNREILRHLRNLCMEENVKNIWSDSNIIGCIQLILNSTTHSETNNTPFHLTFGDTSPIYFKMPKDEAEVPTEYHNYVKKLNEHLVNLRKCSEEFRNKKVFKRTSTTTDIPNTSINTYSKGDIVAYIPLDKRDKIDKLSSSSLGPYSVHLHNKNSNNVTVRNLITDALLELSAARIKILTINKKKCSNNGATSNATIHNKQDNWLPG